MGELLKYVIPLTKHVIKIYFYALSYIVCLYLREKYTLKVY